MLITWIWFRNLCFPYLAYGVYEHYMYLYPLTEVRDYIIITVIFLYTLVALHYYWLYLFFMMAYNLVFKGKVEDTKNNIEEALKAHKDKWD